MPLEQILKTYANIRRKAYNIDNPEQAMRSSGWKANSLPLNPESGLNCCAVPRVESLYI